MDNVTIESKSEQFLKSESVYLANYQCRKCNFKGITLTQMAAHHRGVH